MPKNNYNETTQRFIKLCADLKTAELMLAHAHDLQPQEVDVLSIAVQKAAGAVLTFCAREAYWFPDSTTFSIMKSMNVSSELLAKGYMFVEHV